MVVAKRKLKFSQSKTPMAIGRSSGQQKSRQGASRQLIRVHPFVSHNQSKQTKRRCALPSSSHITHLTNPFAARSNPKKVTKADGNLTRFLTRAPISFRERQEETSRNAEITSRVGSVANWLLLSSYQLDSWHSDRECNRFIGI